MVVTICGDERHVLESIEAEAMAPLSDQEIKVLTLSAKVEALSEARRLRPLRE
jgi:hypothetical protein